MSDKEKIQDIINNFENDEFSDAKDKLKDVIRNRKNSKLETDLELKDSIDTEASNDDNDNNDDDDE